MGKQIWYKPVEPKNFGSDVSVRPYRLWGRVRGVPRQLDRGRPNVLFFLVAEVNNMAAGSLTLEFQYDNCTTFLE